MAACESEGRCHSAGMTPRWLVGLMLAVAGSACGVSEVDAGSSESALGVSPASDPSSFVLGTWNLEHFGSPTHGPSDDALQVANAQAVIARLAPDVLGLQEITSPARFEELVGGLPGYEGVVVNDPRVLGGPEAYATIRFRPARHQEGPRLLHRAVVFRTAKASLVRAQSLPDIDPGRAPIEVVLTVDAGGTKIELVLVVVHFYPSAEPASWERRRDSAERLKRYLDASHPRGNVAVVGDFNDDIDESIIVGYPTPYAAFTNDRLRYTFTTRYLTSAGLGTTTSYPATIDHHLVSNELAERFAPRSAWVERPWYIPDYRATTSDHYPVITRYRLSR